MKQGLLLQNLRVNNGSLPRSFKDRMKLAISTLAIGMELLDALGAPHTCRKLKLEKNGWCVRRESDRSLSVRLSWTARALVTMRYDSDWRQSWRRARHRTLPFLRKPTLRSL